MTEGDASHPQVQLLDAERRIQELHAGLALALASIRAAYIRVDRQGCVSDMNTMAQEITGWPLSEARGLSIWSVFQREGRPEHYLKRNPIEVLQEQDWQAGEGRPMVLIARDGRPVSVEVYATVSHGPDGHPDGMVLVFRDQSALYQAQTAAHRLAAIVESSHDAIVGKALDGTITSWNQAAERLFGYSADEAVGMSVMALIPPERRNEEMQILARLVQGDRIPALETVRLSRDGQRIDVSLSISPVRDHAGTIIGAAKIARDITQELAARQARARVDGLERENREVLEAMRTKSLFLASMSHELRTPLNAIIGFAQLLHESPVAVSEEKRQQFVAHILSAGRHLLEMINDVLDLSKVEAGRIDFNPVEFDVRAAVHDLIETLRPLAQSRQHRLREDLDPDVGPVLLDPVRLRQILYNYLSNAIKFTPPGGDIVVRTRARGRRSFLLEVQDNGAGLSDADQAELFQEFRQLRRQPGQDSAGTGLGLALTRRLAQAQGGSAGVASEPGRGSRFYVVLPVRHAHPSGLEAASTVNDAGRTAVHTPRVVVVDDDHSLNRDLMDRLRDTGVTVERTDNVLDAGKIAATERVDAFVLGLEVAGRNGLELLIRQGPEAAVPPVGALNVALDRDHVASFPVAGVIPKPSTPRDVGEALAQCAEGARSPTVMVVDDDPLSLTLMDETLRGWGVSAILFRSAEAALAHLERDTPDLIILDLLMPVMDGFEVLAAIRRRPDLMHLPVFIWTSLTLTTDEQDRLRRSAARVLSKGEAALDGLLAELLPIPARTTAP
ncbi:PAS domain S-box protein [Roseateles amylovorans]|uniref:histidine kinase n=1 Tax=Roseateles amylovorans TaxID=2978473 RepID=A0ABY6B5A2_9BURK|nr:PAS domain S-box protein [Roseateles amylovorans]UXH79130.1 PAS domain S-box protein [Roseateles amylovorans]